MNFGSHTDRVVGAAVEIVNVATPGWCRGRRFEVPTGADLAEALRDATRSGARTRPLRQSELAALVEVARRARPVFEQMQDGRPDAAAATANELLAHYRPTPYLDRHDGEPWHLHFHGNPEADVSGWGGGIAVALAGVLGSEHADRLGVCEAPACDRVFVDVSRNGTRRFCSTACQNRVKVAAHRARTRT
jgi:predicted RNA-binding Zn ribbon-like protein